MPVRVECLCVYGSKIGEPRSEVGGVRACGSWLRTHIKCDAFAEFIPTFVDLAKRLL